MQGRSLQREQKLLLCWYRLPWIWGGIAPYFALTSGDSDSLWRSDSAMAISRSAPRSHGVGLEASYWHAGVGHSASKYLQRGHHCSIVSLWSQEPGFDKRRHLAWVGEEDVGEVPCGAHSVWMTAVASRRLHTVRSVPECFRTTFPVFTWSTALVSPSGWACDGVA